MNPPPEVVELVHVVPDAEDQLHPAARRVLSAINDEVAAQRTTEEIVDFLFAHTQDLCPGDRISIALLEEGGRRLVAHYTRATYDATGLRKGYADDVRGSTLEALITTRSVRLIHDLEAYLAWKPKSRSTRVLVREGVRSSLTCPLLVHDRVVGVLFRSAREPRAYDVAHARVHTFIAARVSQAIEKTLRIEELAAANLAYAEMLGFVSHELKSPVAAMVATAQLVHDGYVGAVSEPQREAMTRIITKGGYLLELVRDYLELARLEGGALELELRDDVDLAKDVLALALDLARTQQEERRIRIELVLSDELGLVTLDVALMRVVLANLVGNAVKYGRDDGLVRVFAERVADTLVIRVWNEGPGFPAEQRSRLFRRFSRLKTRELQAVKGSGVGLYTVWRLVSLHGGTVDARSELGAWAEFECRLPQPARADTRGPSPTPDT